MIAPQEHCSPRPVKPKSFGISQVVGHLLTEAGYTLWYWGYKNPYMEEYDSYGGLLMNNKKEFWPRWQSALRLACCEAADPLKRQRVEAQRRPQTSPSECKEAMRPTESSFAHPNTCSCVLPQVLTWPCSKPLDSV